MLEHDERAGETWARCIIPIEYFPSSLSSPAWTTPFHGGSFLMHCARNLRRMAPFPILIVTPACTSETIRDHLKALPFESLLTASVRVLPALREAAQHLGLSRILAVHCAFGTGLLPDSVLAEMAELHFRDRPDITVADELPVPLYAHLYEMAALNAVCELSQGPQAADNPRLAVDALRTAIRTLPPGQGQFRVGNINVLDRHGLKECPKSIPCQWAEDVRLLAGVLPSEGNGNPKVLLGELRQKIIDNLESPYHLGRRKPRRSARRLRILYASNPSAYSGGEACLIRSIESLSAEIEPHALVAIEGLLTERLRSIGVAVHCPGGDFAVPTAKNYLAVADVLDCVKPDLVHANALVGPALLAACVRQGIPFVQWMRRAECGGLEEHLACAERITAVSQFIARMLSGEMVRQGKVRVLYDAVDCEQCTPDRPPRRDLNVLYGIGRDERVILCVARFVPYKRHEVLVEAFSRLARQKADVRLVLIGSKPTSGPSTYEECVAMVNARGLSDRVLFLDFQQDVLDFEQRADVVVLCSEREPLGTVVLESMAFGKPIIVAASGGLSEMIDDRVSGLHCAAGDADSLHAQLLRMLGDRQLARILGANARKAALERFSIPVHASELRALYAEVLGSED